MIDSPHGLSAQKSEVARMKKERRREKRQIERMEREILEFESSFEENVAHLRQAVSEAFFQPSQRVSYDRYKTDPVAFFESNRPVEFGFCWFEEDGVSVRIGEKKKITLYGTLSALRAFEQKHSLRIDWVPHKQEILTALQELKKFVKASEDALRLLGGS